MRQIQISYVDGAGNTIPGNTKETNNHMRIISVVQWGNNQKIELETILTDFLERHWHDS